MKLRMLAVVTLAIAGIVVTAPPAAAAPVVTYFSFEDQGTRNYNHPANNVPNTFCYDFSESESLVYSGTVFITFKALATVCWRISGVVAFSMLVSNHPLPSSAYQPSALFHTNVGPIGQPTLSWFTDGDYEDRFNGHDIDVDVIYGKFEIRPGDGAYMTGVSVFSDYLFGGFDPN